MYIIPTSFSYRLKRGGGGLEGGWIEKDLMCIIENIPNQLC